MPVRFGFLDDAGISAKSSAKMALVGIAPHVGRSCVAILTSNDYSDGQALLY